MVKDGDFRGGLTYESICVSEPHDICACIIKEQCDMKERYDIKILHIIVDDGLMQKPSITSISTTEITLI